MKYFHKIKTHLKEKIAWNKKCFALKKLFKKRQNIRLQIHWKQFRINKINGFANWEKEKCLNKTKKEWNHKKQQ